MDLDPFLHLHTIPLRCHAHPAVMPCAQADLLVPNLPGVRAKNLFLHARKPQRHPRVTVPPDRTVDLTRLGEHLRVGRLGLASPDRLANHLDESPGSVSLLALFNSEAHAVDFVIDRGLWEANARRAHPQVITATAVVTDGDLVRFLAAVGHTPRIVDVPFRILEEVRA